jgi:hypothetical protein
VIASDEFRRHALELLGTGITVRRNRSVSRRGISIYGRRPLMLILNIRWSGILSALLDGPGDRGGWLGPGDSTIRLAFCLRGRAHGVRPAHTIDQRL